MLGANLQPEWWTQAPDRRDLSHATLRLGCFESSSPEFGIYGALAHSAAWRLKVALQKRLLEGESSHTQLESSWRDLANSVLATSRPPDGRTCSS